MSDSKEHVPSSFDNRLSFILSFTLITTETLITGPISAARCTFAAFASNASLLFSACMYFSLNLQLVPVHGVNGLKMKKYVGPRFVAVCNFAPLAVGGQFGLYNGVSSSELVCFVILVSYMLHRQMALKRVLSDVSAEMTALQHAAYSAAPILQFGDIILRISTAINFAGSILDFYLAKHLGNTELNFQLSLLDLCIFNARLFLYAVLAATDPSFRRAIGALRNPHRSAGPDGSQQSSSTAKAQSWSSRGTTPSLCTRTLVDGSNTEGESAESMVRLSLDAAGRPRQTETDTHHTRRHRDPEEGIE
ncbi:hypothetical protein MVEN_01856300 [Mycena venus]|uniref:Uncharacterized protein n=1 Tax=Mycena venus TaxID=2733690 RepID=A0A8H6XIT6_9AGAR|nr:hypothetical protein MVEN_01856300 [Mycena venus]